MKSRHSRPGEILARRLQEARKRRGWTQQQLADRVTEFGHPMSRVVVTKIEQGGERADNAPIVEVLALAAALGITPPQLLDPHDEDHEDEQEVAIGALRVPAPAAQAWLRGAGLLPGGDFGAYLAALPRKQQEALMRSYFESGLDQIGKALLTADTDERVADALRELTEPKEEKDG